MIDLSTLPREPELAIKSVLLSILGDLPKGSTALRGQLPQALENSLILDYRLAKNVVMRLKDQDIKQVVLSSLTLNVAQSGNWHVAQINGSIDALVHQDLDDHFLPPEDVEEFENANIPEEERIAIRAALTKAKELANNASFLTNAHKRKFNIKIVKAENELFKEHVGIAAFEAVSFTVLGIVKQFGEAAQPMANAVETARTTTNKYITGHPQIGMDEPPKQIEDKSGETDPSA